LIRVRALLSVADRDGIIALARDLAGLGVELYATDGHGSISSRMASTHSR